MSNDKIILLFGVDDDLFKSCFGKDEEWLPSSLKSLPEECSNLDLQAALVQPGLHCVVCMDVECFDRLQDYYDNGGFVAFFGIYGEFNVPNHLNSQWKFSAYTNHEYELTSVAKHYIGDAISKQQYTKSNLVSAPEGDRIMIPKIGSFEDYLSENFDIDMEDIYDTNDPDTANEVKAARKQWPRIVDELSNQSPLVMHRNDQGGKVAYLGFVNHDGNIPKIVRALLNGIKVIN